MSVQTGLCQSWLETSKTNFLMSWLTLFPQVYRDLALLEEKYEEVASDDVMSMAVKPNKVLNSVR